MHLHLNVMLSLMLSYCNVCVLEGVVCFKHLELSLCLVLFFGLFCSVGSLPLLESNNKIEFALNGHLEWSVSGWTAPSPSY